MRNSWKSGSAGMKDVMSRSGSYPKCDSPIQGIVPRPERAGAVELQGSIVRRTLLHER
jgi:hypothetical protein